MQQIHVCVLHCGVDDSDVCSCKILSVQVLIPKLSQNCTVALSLSVCLYENYATDSCVCVFAYECVWSDRDSGKLIKVIYTH